MRAVPVVSPVSATTDGTAKGYRLGTHRAVPPEETLRRYVPLCPALGITRLANVTGLDRIGIPVVMASRPLSRSIAVAQGKGLSLDAAKASALMEAAETWHAERIDLPLRRAPLADLGDHTTLPAEALADMAIDRFDPHRALLWVLGWNVASEQKAWVPLELVSTDYTLPQPDGSYVFPATTNGLASGNTVVEALCHALYEVIERDAVALWRLGGEAARHRTGIAADSIDSPHCRDLLDRYDNAGVTVGLWDVTSDIGVPTYCCIVVDREGEAVEPELGTGCHPDPEVALLRAMTEAAQARITRIAGSRDDFAPDTFGESARATRRRAARSWLTAPSQMAFGSSGSLSTTTLEGDLQAVLARLEAADVGPVLAVDLTRPAFGLPVVRVVVPGLERPHTGTGAAHRPGPRARRLAAGGTR